MKHIAVIDLAYGDSGKGVLVDRLCDEQETSLVVRFNGGCQAAHNVVTDDGRHHTFAQFGSGTFHRVPTFLSKYVMVEPLSLMIEAQHLESVGVGNALGLMNVSDQALVTTPYHWLLNRWREDQRGNGRHGSCGRGVGATAEYALQKPYALRVGDLDKELLAVEKLHDIRAWAEVESGQAMPDPRDVFAKYDAFRRAVKVVPDSQLSALGEDGRIVFEGAQGVLLDENWGFHPHTTWSPCTGLNARALVQQHGLGELEEVGVVRTYTTRHGAGPFVPEDSKLDLPELHNTSERYQGSWRVGHFDGPAITYAMRSNNGVDSVYVTHVDAAHREKRLRVCTGYVAESGHETRLLPYLFNDYDLRAAQTKSLLTARPILAERARNEWGESIADYLGVPLAGVGYGPQRSAGAFTEAVRA